MADNDTRTATLTKVKQALRIRHSVLDDDIGADIDACLEDLRVCGIDSPDETDALIYAAIKLYCLAHYTDDTDKGAAYLVRYNAHKSCLMMAEGYGYREGGCDG